MGNLDEIAKNEVAKYYKVYIDEVEEAIFVKNEMFHKEAKVKDYDIYASKRNVVFLVTGIFKLGLKKEALDILLYSISQLGSVYSSFAINLFKEEGKEFLIEIKESRYNSLDEQYKKRVLRKLNTIINFMEEYYG